MSPNFSMESYFLALMQLRPLPKSTRKIIVSKGKESCEKEKGQKSKTIFTLQLALRSR